jgi:TetR/AcrR family transcriptional repressor of nem operon
VKVSRAQADKNRDRVIEVAGRLFRERGFDGISLVELMGAAGLTRGGFYGHFRSKEDLEVLACERAMRTTVATWSSLMRPSVDDPLMRLVKFYLSDRQRDELGEGCALTALASDAARHGPALRSAFTRGLAGYLEVLCRIVPGRREIDRRRKAFATLSQMVGAVILARVVDDRTLSNEILDASAADLSSRAVRVSSHGSTAI